VKKIFVFTGMLIILVAAGSSMCVMWHPGIKPIKKKVHKPVTYKEAKKELDGLLEQRERLKAMRKKTLAKLKAVTRGGYATGGLTLRLRGQLRMIRNIDQELVDQIAQLMKQHPSLMRYLPKSVGFLPVMPFLPFVPIRPRMMPIEKQILPNVNAP